MTNCSRCPPGKPFSIHITRSMTHREVHGIFYRTANREVTLTLRSGIKVSGTLDESPGFFREMGVARYLTSRLATLILDS